MGLKEWFDRNLAEIEEEDATETMKLLRDKVKKQTTEIRDLTNSLLNTEEKLTDANVKAKRLQFRINELEEADKTISKLEAQIKDKDKQIESYLADKNIIKDLEASIKRQEDEIAYYKRFTDELQSLPAYKKLLDNVAALKVPDIQTLVDTFTKLNNETNIIEKIGGLDSKIESICNYLRNRY